MAIDAESKRLAIQLQELKGSMSELQLRQRSKLAKLQQLFSIHKQNADKLARLKALREKHMFLQQ